MQKLQIHCSHAGSRSLLQTEQIYISSVLSSGLNIIYLLSLYEIKKGADISACPFPCINLWGFG
jgi:hypothetical protein